MAAASAAAGRGAGAPGKRECMEGKLALFGLLFFLVALAEVAVPSEATTFTVGDAQGWTILGNPNYTAWAASKTFRVGDTVVFKYNKQFHNVLQVTNTNYDGCSAASPIATHTSGDDSIVLKTAGHHYFLCGVTGHCAAGQRVDVNVLASSASAPAASAPAASPPGSPSVPSPTTTTPPSAASGPGSAPPPEKSRASPVASGNYVVGCAAALLLAAAVPMLHL